jgi:hypothetical protein
MARSISSIRASIAAICSLRGTGSVGLVLIPYRFRKLVDLQVQRSAAGSGDQCRARPAQTLEPTFDSPAPAQQRLSLVLEPGHAVASRGSISEPKSKLLLDIDRGIG